MPDLPFPRQDALLGDMLEAANLIVRYMRGMTFAEFCHNKEKQDAVAMRLVLIGESATKIDPGTEASLPDIPFRAMRGLRNRIVHDYGAVNFHDVWTIAQKEVKPLIKHLQAHLGKFRRR